MAGIYIHIPFCKSRCIYCGFYSTVRLSLRQRYVDALCREWQLRKHELTEPIETVYLGGGTPSQLSAEQLCQLLSALPTKDAVEITVECNPDDITSQMAELLLAAGVNRISMGAQTFSNQRLQFLRRRHTAAQVQKAISILRHAGVSNISVDLMYGFPGETLSDLQYDIEHLLSIGVEHVSTYCLMIEEGTVLYEKMRDGENERMRNGENERMGNGENEKMRENEGMRECDEDTERAMYELICDRMAAGGYEHYEISNFAKPGFRSRHNSSYWHDVPYIGLGAAAHSYNRNCRSWNVSDIGQYIDAIEHDRLPSECELIDADTHYNDLVTTALRTSDGLDLTTLSDSHRRHCTAEAQRFIATGLLQQSGNSLILTRKGLFVSDYIMSSLMKV